MITIKGKQYEIVNVEYNDKMKVARVETKPCERFILHGNAFYPFDKQITTVEAKLIEKYGA